MIQLPVECLYLIYQYLSTADLITLQQVSSYLRKSTNDILVWKNSLCIIGNGQFKSSRASGNARRYFINEYSCYWLKPYLFYIESATNKGYSDFTYSVARVLFPTMRNLRSLNLSRNDDVRDDTMQLLASHCRFLERLDISYCRSLTSKAIFALVKRLNLEFLDVSSTRCMTNKAWLVICAMNDSIRTLIMSNSYMINWSILAGIVPPRLTKWDISDNYTISFPVLKQIVMSRALLQPAQRLIIDIRNCDSITADEICDLAVVKIANVEFIANPKLKNNEPDGIRQYLESIINC